MQSRALTAECSQGRVEKAEPHVRNEPVTPVASDPRLTAGVQGPGWGHSAAGVCRNVLRAPGMPGPQGVLCGCRRRPQTGLAAACRERAWALLWPVSWRSPSDSRLSVFP